MLLLASRRLLGVRSWLIERELTAVRVEPTGDDWPPVFFFSFFFIFWAEEPVAIRSLHGAFSYLLQNVCILLSQRMCGGFRRCIPLLPCLCHVRWVSPGMFTCRLNFFIKASAIRDGQGEALMQGPLSPIASCHGHLGIALHSEVENI